MKFSDRDRQSASESAPTGGGVGLIRAARREQAAVLTELSVAAKRHWRYPEAFFDIWRPELTISAEYIDANICSVYEERGRVLGYYALVRQRAPFEVAGVTLPAGFWLEHLFVLPVAIGRSVGSQLFTHLRAFCRREGVAVLHILVDPHSRGFYEKMGCCYLKEIPSSIPGRTTPLFRLTIETGDRGRGDGNGTGSARP